LQELNSELASQSLTDVLTNLKNRRSFDRLLANEYSAPCVPAHRWRF
jgi:GGDEF domain-containing protein